MQQNKSLLPISIIIAGVLIAGALYFGNGSGTAKVTDSLPQEPILQAVDSTDHILGNKNAVIKLVEYSDPQCRFCRAFHPTMKKIMSEFGEDGKVAWVYRHFAILGPQSETEAQATECAAELGGEEKFWQYLDLLFNSKDESTKLPENKTLAGLAKEIGLDGNMFNQCLESNKYSEKINKLRESAIQAGGRGTPYTLISNDKGEIMGIINGAQTYEVVKDAVEQALKN